ncbi:hypothetical protein GCM10023172_16850 [Hymenobacter ginsengisoli]|uniref:Uncharacterized protein n=1 Tax=Hymenobacter ginsengisoli TaxID=1051626 RepID=A0ABP8Q9J2_9BACT|nr:MULTISPECIES: hypothetical protein [unclassified Hymenobacter]MBO2030771.1 hypothetical protein [Hymenobacter sp. BT559]
MPKLIDYPRTSYTGAWEVAEVVDDTGGKCALETCARKLNRKVSGSFKAIIGSAVKFGLLTSKREMLTTTTLFRRIKHAYDKQEELVFHREAFLNPPLFTQLCRKFRSRELPVAMLDVLLIREFDVEEINAQGVAKAFVDGARMVGLLDEHNIMADIDQLAAQQPARRELASPAPSANVFRQSPLPLVPSEPPFDEADDEGTDEVATPSDTAVTTAPPASTSSAPARPSLLPPARMAPQATSDAIASLFGLAGTVPAQPPTPSNSGALRNSSPNAASAAPVTQPAPAPSLPAPSENEPNALVFRIQVAGPGLNTSLEVVDVEDLAVVRALLSKIERRLSQ